MGNVNPISALGCHAWANVCAMLAVAKANVVLKLLTEV